MTSDVKGWEQRCDGCRRFCPLVSSLGSAGARQTRRWLTRIAVGGLPPDGPPSGAGLMRGTSVPVGRCTPPRVTPHRGGASAASGGHARTGVRQHAASVLRAVARSPAWPGPTGRHVRPGPWRPRPAGPGGLWPAAGETVCRAGPAPASGGPGALEGAWPSAGAGDPGAGLETARPRPRRRGHAGQGSSPSWSGRPADGAPRWHRLRACAPDHACAVAGSHRVSGRPGLPPWSPPRCTGHRAEPGGPRPPARSARCAPARGVRVPDAVSGRAGPCRSGRRPDRPSAARVGDPPLRGASAGGRDSRGPDLSNGYQAAARRR